MQAIFGLTVLFATVLCAVPVTLTFIEVRRLRKELDRTHCSRQPSLAAKQESRFFGPTAEAGSVFDPGVPHAGLIGANRLLETTILPS